jgi:hypothetical protein
LTKNHQIIINQLKHNEYFPSPDGDRAIIDQAGTRKKTKWWLFQTIRLLSINAGYEAGIGQAVYSGSLPEWKNQREKMTGTTDSGSQ